MSRSRPALIDLGVMVAGDVERFAQLHQHNPAMTAAAIEYEYFGNSEEGSKLMLGSVDGETVASQAFIAQQLILDGQFVPTLMSERTFLAPLWRGRADFTSFYLASLRESFRALPSVFVWGGTAAVRPFASGQNLTLGTHGCNGSFRPSSGLSVNDPLRRVAFECSLSRA